MVIGSGPIIIGQAAEFDYAGAQACRVLKEAGVNVMYHTSFVDAITDGDKIETVVVAKKEGLCAIKPKIVIDCSGDGDCAVA